MLTHTKIKSDCSIKVFQQSFAYNCAGFSSLQFSDNIGVEIAEDPLYYKST